MKNLFCLVILTAFVAVGGVFLGKWSIPGLESMPTMEALRSSEQDDVENLAERRMKSGNEGGRPAAYYTTGTSSASEKRNRQLNKAGKEMGVER